MPPRSRIGRGADSGRRLRSAKPRLDAQGIRPTVTSLFTRETASGVREARPEPDSIMRRRTAHPAGRWCNGNTADSGSVYRGSNPCLPAKRAFHHKTLSFRDLSVSPPGSKKACRARSSAPFVGLRATGVFLGRPRNESPEAGAMMGHRPVQAGVAQLVEHLICNQTVGGSNPLAGSRAWSQPEGRHRLSSSRATCFGGSRE